MPHYKDLNGKLHELDNDAFEHLLPSGCEKISDAESVLLSTINQLTPQPEPLPLIQDQLDALFKGGTAMAEMKAKVIRIKSEHKP